jgi:class 3 adenylate cyclase
MASRRPAGVPDKDYGNRRLVVVAAFDVVGFSALVEADEDNALAAWRTLRREIDPLIARGGGCLFKSLGDGLLVEFTSPFDATRSALEVQAAVTKMTPQRDIRLELRCAIHMGDVTVEGTDLLGDGINVVSRLQDHAPVGAVLVSSAVMDLIGGRIDAPIQDLGTLKLKNISRLCTPTWWAPASGPSRCQRSTATNGAGHRLRCCRSSTSRPKRRPRISAMAWSRTSSRPCRACPN